MAFSLAADKTGHPLAFEPEGSPSDEALAWNVMTWGQYQFPFTPLVDKYKWLETRHMVNISHRWNRDKTDDLQFAFFNGVGWESWENIWGIWNGITPRDAEATRRVATIERGVAPFLVSKDWEPMSPMLRYGVYASRWPLGGETVWTIVNRNEYDVEGDQIEVAAKDNLRYFDLYHGVELKPQAQAGWQNSTCFFDRSQRVWRRPGDQHRTRPEGAGLDVQNERADGNAAGRVTRTNGKSCPSRSFRSQATKSCKQRACGHGQDPGGGFSFQGFRNRD